MYDEKMFVSSGCDALVLDVLPLEVVTVTAVADAEVVRMPLGVVLASM